MDYRFDAYLAGHEHTLTYAHFPYGEEPLEKQPEDDGECHYDTEDFYGDSKSRVATFSQGDSLHHLTTG